MSELLPCPNCGNDAFEGENVTVTIEGKYQFGEDRVEHDVAGKRCPHCLEEFAL